MANIDKPVKVYLDTLADEFGMDANDTCGYLLADRKMHWFSGKRLVNPREIAHDPDRSQLHKRLKDKEPGEQPLEVFDPFATSVPPLFDALLAALGRREGLARGSATSRVLQVVVRVAPAMLRSLHDHTRGADIYDNLLDGVRSCPFRSERDRALAAFLLFTEAGMVGDPMQFGPMAERDIRTLCGVDVLQVAPLDHAPLADDDGADLSQAVMALQRVHAGGVRGRRHTLDPAGTLIGSMPITEGSYLADVDRTVSFEHLLVRMREDGAWVAEGLGAEYGTYLLRPGEDDPIVVEPVLASQATWEDGPVELRPGDVLVLGTTRFEVQLFQRGE